MSMNESYTRGYSEIKHDGIEMGRDNVDMGHGGTSKVVRLLMVSRVRVK